MHAAETDDELNKIREAFQIQPEQGIIKYLDSLDVLDKHVVAAHCVAVTKADIETLKERKVKVAHNPTSNLKLASGVSPIPRMLRENITVSIGTDGPCSNNTADMFDAMKITALIHKGINKDPTLLPASKVLEMATLEGAASLSWENEMGSIENGKKADLVIINFKKPHLCPLYNERSHLVYAVKSTDVETVIINGKIVMENRQLTTVYTEEVMRLAEKSKENLAKKSKQ